MLQSSSLPFLISGMGDNTAGAELINAIQTQALLSPSSFTRLESCFGENQVAQNFQNCILGNYALSARDIEFVTDGFELPIASLADVLSNLAGGVGIGVPIPNTGPQNISMPSGFSASTVTQGPAQQPVISLSMPAGSAFPSFGAGAYFTLFTAGNTNQYDIWYNVSGGTNVNPAPIGFTGIEATILSSDSAAAIATKTQAAIALDVAAATSSVSSNKVTVIPTVVSQAAALPTFSPNAGTYGSSQTVSLSSATAGASIYYTTDGSQPSINSSLYSTPITVSASEQVNAIAIKNGFANSIVNGAAYIIGGSQVATPTFSPVAGTYAGSQMVTVSSLTSSALFYYTLDGSTPTTGSTAYAGPILINASETLKVLAVKAGLSNSAVGSAAYTISALGPALPSLGAASAYRILSESGISDTSGSAVTGEMGVSPIAHTAITGFTLTLDGSGQFSTAPNVTGHIFAADYSAPTPANLTTAVANMTTAYTNAQGLTTPTQTNPGAGALGGLTLAPGLYKLTVPTSITGTLTLNGGVNDTWVFQCSSTLNLASSAQIVMTGGAQASNVMWAVAGSVTAGVSSVFRGTILASTNVAMQTTSTYHGTGIYAQTAVTLDDVAVSS
jgi:hypothetical protein